MKVSLIPLSNLENIPLINFPKDPISLEVNKNIPEITNTKYTYEEHFVKYIPHVMVCVYITSRKLIAIGCSIHDVIS